MIPRMKDQHQRILIPRGSVVKNPSANAGDTGVYLILGSGRSPRGGNSNPLQYSHLKKSHGQRSLVARGVAESDMT